MVRIKNFFKSSVRYLKSILPAFLFFTTLLFTYSTPVFASTSGGEIVEYKPEVTSPTIPKSLIDEIKDKALNWFFPNLSEYEETCAKSTLSAATKLYEKYSNGNMSLYEYYLENVCLGMRSLIGTTSAFPAYTGWKSANDVILYVDEHYVGTDIDWDQVSTDVALKAVQDFIDPTTQQIKKVERAVTSDDVNLPAADLNEAIPKLNKQYFPKNATGIMSYRTDELFHNCYDSWSSPLEYCMLDFYAGDFGFSATGDKKEMYFVFFEKLGDSSFYGQYQFHCTITAEDIYYEDRDEVEHTNYTLSFECWDIIDGSQSNPTSLSSITKTSPYFVLALNSSRPELYNFSSYSNYISGNASSWNTVLTDYNLIRSLWKSDLSTSIRFSYSDQQHFKGALSSHNSSCSYNGSCDFGYLASSAPISTLYNIDTTRIPENYYITVSGDTIYDYSITNPETGQKDTIQNFITNNYTFNNGDTNIDTGDHNTSIGGSGSGNGGGGDVNVNVTVNNNIGGGDGGSYDMPDTSFFDDYLDDALEESTGIRKFISDFFNSLPGQITKLICTGLVLAILCRLIGR